MNTPVNPPQQNPFLSKVKVCCKKVATFIYETPLWVVASAVAGVALLFFAPLFSAPFLGLAAATILSRLVVKIIEHYNPQKIRDFKEKVLEFQKKHTYIEYLAIAITVAVTPFLPIGAAVIGVGLGIYKGLIVELEIFKYSQVVRREENPRIVDEQIHAIAGS